MRLATQAYANSIIYQAYNVQVCHQLGFASTSAYVDGEYIACKLGLSLSISDKYSAIFSNAFSGPILGNTMLEKSN